MKRTTVFLDAGLERDLQLIADREHRSTASVVREALTEFVAGRKSAAAPRLRFVGAGRSGTSETAERHEDLLFGQDVGARPRRASKPKPPAPSRGRARAR